jgi:hypothetical protein
VIIEMPPAAAAGLIEIEVVVVSDLEEVSDFVLVDVESLAVLVFVVVPVWGAVVVCAEDPADAPLLPERRGEVNGEENHSLRVWSYLLAFPATHPRPKARRMSRMTTPRTPCPAAEERTARSVETNAW